MRDPWTRRGAGVLLALALAASEATADEAALQRRIEDQNELIRRQAEQMQQMEDRLRALEDEQRAQPKEVPSVEGTVQPLPEAQLGHVPGSGFPVDSSDWGSLRIRLYTYARYLNQKGLDKNYTDDFGQTTSIDRRNNFQLNKVTLYSFGWILDPKFHYLLYV